MNKKALLIIDVQNDFLEGGSLAVGDSMPIIPLINSLRTRPEYSLIVLTQDWHPANHSSFASNHDGAELFSMVKTPRGADQVAWPDHCVQGTTGAEFHTGLQTQNTDAVVRKGMNVEVDSYSGFMDNDKGCKTELEELLKKNGITAIDCVGLAADYCVGNTALDGAAAGFKVTLFTDCTRPVAADTWEEMKTKLEEAGVTMKESGCV